jgi:nitrate/nitrite transport system substrate-binding protein
MAERLGDGLETRDVRLGIIPLTDCAAIAVAHEHGWFRKYGLAVAIAREPSWANIRDKVATGALDGGHMLAAMPIAASLGLGGFGRPMVTALSLGLNGCAITLSLPLWRQLLEIDAGAAASALAAAHALQRVIAHRRAAGAPPLNFAAVFPYSAHNYLLRYWLAAGGIDPDEDVRIRVVPPPLMVANMAARHIDGCCVGEPWGQHAVEQGVGHCVVASRDIWTGHPDKVLGVSADWAARHPNTHRALVAALVEAARWLDRPEHRAETARLLAERGYVDLPEATIAASLALPDFHIFHRGAAGFPWHSHAAWTLSQMRRWGQIDASVNLRATAAAVYRPDIFRDVAAALGLPCPTGSWKTEGRHGEPWALDGTGAPIVMGPDRFVDGRVFDPARLDDYLADFAPPDTARAALGGSRNP